MREIKFRVWYDSSMSPPVELKEMIGSIVKHPELALAFAESNSVIMQYTGLLDKDDKEIYEGDILKTDDGDVYEIIFNEGGFWPRDWDDDWVADWITEWKVIGNIHENKELLK